MRMEPAENEKLWLLLRCAIQAPSPRNTQPWRFGISDRGVDLYADGHRWQHVADRDQRELYISVGCALENLLVAARHFSYRAVVDYCPRPLSGPDPAFLELAARVSLHQGETPPDALGHDALFYAITERHTDHTVYDRTLVFHEALEAIEACGVDEGVHLRLITDADNRSRLDHLVTRTDLAEFADPAFRHEIVDVIDQGVFGPPWSPLSLRAAVTARLGRGKATVRQDHALMTSAPILGLLSSERDHRASQVRVGQVLERIWLTVTAFGVHLHPMSQMLEVPKIKAQLVRFVHDGDLIPQQPFLLGHVDAQARPTPRRPLGDFLLD